MSSTNQQGSQRRPSGAHFAGPAPRQQAGGAVPAQQAAPAQAVPIPATPAQGAPTQPMPRAAAPAAAGGYGTGAYAGSVPGWEDFNDVPTPSYSIPPQTPQGGKGGKKKGRGTLVVAIILLVVGLGLLAGAGVTLFLQQRDYQANEQEYAELRQNVTEDPTTGEPIVDFATLKAENPEVVGWLYMPEAEVNYPIVQHEDNDYYLNRNFHGEEDAFGAIYMDYRCQADLSDRTTVIYGHHLRNGNMFAPIAETSDQAEFDAFGDFYYVTDDDAVHVLTPLATMVVTGTDVDSVRTEFTDNADFTSYVQSLIDRASARREGATAEGITHVYLFSTCSYAHENDRTILIAVEKSEVDAAATDATADLQAIQDVAGEMTAAEVEAAEAGDEVAPAEG